MNDARYEYEGFHYLLDLDEDGKAYAAFPLIGQHKAAGKEKHCRAARNQYNDERNMK